MAAFNSDDLVFNGRADASRSQSRPGAKSIDLIFEHAAADRMSTKKLVEQLKSTDGGIAPGCGNRSGSIVLMAFAQLGFKISPILSLVEMLPASLLLSCTHPSLIL